MRFINQKGKVHQNGNFGQLSRHTGFVIPAVRAVASAHSNRTAGTYPASEFIHCPDRPSLILCRN